MSILIHCTWPDGWDHNMTKPPCIKTSLMGCFLTCLDTLPEYCCIAKTLVL